MHPQHNKVNVNDVMKKYICKNCGAKMDKPRHRTRGAGGCLLMGFLFLITIPTIIGPIIIAILDCIWYRSSLKTMCCPFCDGERCVIPLNSPEGRRIEASYRSIPNDSVSATSPLSPQIVYDPKTHQYVKRG